MKWKTLRRRVATAIAALAMPIAALHADPGEAVADFHTDPPSGEILCSFGHGEESNGWTWYSLGSSSRNIGFSFKVPHSVEIREITLFVRHIKGKEARNAAFQWQLFQTESPTQPPEVGQRLAFEDGEMIVDPANTGMYLTFRLGQPIAVEPGCYYLFTLSWGRDVSSCSIQFAIDKDYHDGRCWYTQSGSPEAFRPLHDATLPGIVFSIQ